MLQPKREAIQEAKRNQNSQVFWKNGLRLDKKKVGVAVVWFDKKQDKWQEKRRYLGKNKDFYDVEL